MNHQSETIGISLKERAIFQSLSGQVIACAIQNALTIVIVVSNMAKGSHPSKLEEILKKELHTTKCQGLGFAGGGCINEGQSFDTDDGKVFVKVNDKSGVFMPMGLCHLYTAQGNLLFDYFLFVLLFQAMKMFEGEFNSLEAICRTNTVRVPKPIKVCFN